jgi:hypothetical protein
MRSRCCLHMCVCVSHIFARQRLGNNPIIVARQWIGRNPPIVARQRVGRDIIAVTNTHATIEELLDVPFSLWPVSYQGKQAISSSQNFLFILVTFVLMPGSIIKFQNHTFDILRIFRTLL